MVNKPLRYMLSRRCMDILRAADPDLLELIEWAIRISIVSFKVNEARDRAIKLTVMQRGEECYTLANYKYLNNALQAAAEQLGLEIFWGGDLPNPEYQVWTLE